MKTPSVLLLVVLACAIRPAGAQTLSGNPLSGLERLKDFETRRASSSDANWKDGNGDARPIAPGGTLRVAELEGPGSIAHIWCTIAHDAPFYSRLLTLRIYWDGEEHPSVECPLGDFFGIGHGVDKAFESLPLRVSSEGRGRNCYWPMPFRKSARIEVTNESDRRCHAFYYYVDWQKYARPLPDDVALFHAAYRQEHPCVMGRNYLLADIVGRGHYVGTIQSVYHMSDGWYGEGDDFFFIDGAAEPQLRGTGTEDYFCDGWGFRQQDGLFYGTPLWEGYRAGDRGTAYRFQIPDPIVFTTSLRAEIEHKGSQTFPDGKGDGFIERDDLMSSVALWYQTEPHKPWPALPPGPARLPFREDRLVVGWKAVPEARHSDAPFEVQEVGGTTDNKQLWFRPAAESGWVEVPFKLDQAVTAEFWVRLVHSWDYGRYRVRIDGRETGVFDLFSPDVTPTPHKLGTHALAAGNHTLSFECAGKNPESKGYFFGFDTLSQRVPVYSRPPGFDLRRVREATKTTQP
jgi:hypothetical protein